MGNTHYKWLSGTITSNLATECHSQYLMFQIKYVFLRIWKVALSVWVTPCETLYQYFFWGIFPSNYFWAISVKPGQIDTFPRAKLKYWNSCVLLPSLNRSYMGVFQRLYGKTITDLINYTDRHTTDGQCGLNSLKRI